MKLLSSLTEMSAGEGFSIVLLSGLQALGALALIVAVLLVMDKIYKKKHPSVENTDESKTEDVKKEEGEKE